MDGDHICVTYAMRTLLVSALLRFGRRRDEWGRAIAALGRLMEAMDDIIHAGWGMYHACVCALPRHEAICWLHRGVAPESSRVHALLCRFAARSRRLPAPSGGHSASLTTFPLSLPCLRPAATKLLRRLSAFVPSSFPILHHGRVVDRGSEHPGFPSLPLFPPRAAPMEGAPHP